MRTAGFFVCKVFLIILFTFVGSHCTEIVVSRSWEGMELSRADIELLRKFFGDTETHRIVVTGHVRKGVLKIQMDVIHDHQVSKSLRAFVGNGRILFFDSK